MEKHFRNAVGLALLFFGWFLPGEAQAVSIHQKVSACRDNFGQIFPEAPVSCDDVCLTCHPGPGPTDIGVISGQRHNPAGKRVDEVFRHLYPPRTGRPEEGWNDLTLEHRSCRDCHFAKMIYAMNHPIFVAIPDDPRAKYGLENTELKMFTGAVLCPTCHNPHDGATPKLLRVGKARSTLCLSCHRK